MAGLGLKVVWAGVALSTLYLLRQLLQRVRLARVAKQNGCVPANSYKHKDHILGIDLLKNQMQAMQVWSGR